MIGYNKRYPNRSLASRSRHKIIVQRKTSTQSSEGGIIESWSDHLTCWASITPVSAVQLSEMASINVEATHLIEVHAKLDIRESDRILLEVL